MPENKYTFIDLFCGAGGMSSGFEDAGFRSVIAIDCWQDALDTYRFNKPEANTLCADLSKVKPEDIKKEYCISSVDVIIGGPPCQGFSIAGKRIIDDVRNKLYKSFVNFVDVFRPKVFVMENVPNILSIGDGLVRDSIIADFNALGYKVNYKILTASDYGVPQNRRRAIFVGSRDGIDFKFPKPSVVNPVTAKEAISDLPEDSIEEGGPYTTPPQSDYQELMRKNSTVVYNHSATVHTEQTKRIIAMVPDGGNYTCLPVELQATRKVHIAWTRLHSDRPSITIDTGHNHHFHYLYNRVPTARESARLQSFPDNYRFLCGKTSQLKQIGNAVPPLMAKAIAEEVKNQLL